MRMSMAAAASGAALTGLLAGKADAVDLTSLKGSDHLPDVLTVDYTFRDYEVVDYDYYSLDSMPRVRLRGPRFDPRSAKPGSFFTAFGSAHTLGVFSPVAYPDLLAEQLKMPAWNVGIGGVSAHFYNSYPQFADYANRGRFAIVQLMAGRMDGNDRIENIPAAQMVRDRKRGDFVIPEAVWGRIEREEPGMMLTYVEQSRAAWAEQHAKLLDSLKVPVVMFWFSGRSLADSGSATRQIGSLEATSFPQFVNGSDVAKIRGKAEAFVECTSMRGSGYKLRTRFTGEPVRVNHRMLGERGSPVDLFDDTNSYYPSPEMQADAAKALFDTVKRYAG